MISSKRLQEVPPKKPMSSFRHSKGLTVKSMNPITKKVMTIKLKDAIIIARILLKRLSQAHKVDGQYVEVPKVVLLP